MDRVDLAAPEPQQLKEYEGDYYSNELFSTYRVKVSNGRLLLRVNNLGWEELDPTVKDEFVPAIRQNHDNRIFQFVRNRQKQVVRLSVTLWRVKGVSFTKTMP